ncbi:MAG: Do family serine endopeptidase [Rhodospirillales bacterium]|nr:Do family serine endopeptidase [Acetobacter sp.]
MFNTTNSLVKKAARLGAPVVLSAAVALGAVAVVNHNGVLASAVTASPLDDHSVAALTSLDEAMETLAARVTPAVVNIAVTSTPSEDAEEGGTAQQQGIPPQFQQFFGPNGPFGGGAGGGRMQGQQPQLQHGIGSGVIISPDGFIVTNNHVVDGARDIKVTLHDRRILNGKVIGVDKLTDLAVVKVNAHDLPFIAWGDSNKLQPGQTVLAFGSPFGYLKFSVTRGIVSAVDRPDPFAKDAHRPGGFIQTDAAINPGNSGGPLVNSHGEVVGINNMIYTNSGSFEGAGFAIPSQIARNVTQQLIAHGKVDHGFVGIAMNDVTPDNAHFFGLKDASGAIVAQVSPDSPASRAGLKQGDVITSFNGQKVTNGSALQVAVSQVSPGTTVNFGVLRNGQPEAVNVTVGSYSPSGTQIADNQGSGGPNTGKLGLGVGDLTDQARQELQVPSSVHGAVIEQVRPASPADDAGLEPGDVILEVNRKPTDSANQFVSAVHGTAQGDLLLLVWSKGNASYRTLHPDSQNG